MISEVVEKISEHWTDRLAVHIWDRLDLSDSNMETLRPAALPVQKMLLGLVQSQNAYSSLDFRTPCWP